MNLSKEILIGLGFKEVKENNYDMYKYCIDGIEPLYLEKASKEKEFYMVYKKNEEDDFTECDHCHDLSSLFEVLMKINHMDSMELGKELKQQEFRSVLRI